MWFGKARLQQTTFAAYARPGNSERPATAAIAPADSFAIRPTNRRRESRPGFVASSSALSMRSVMRPSLRSASGQGAGPPRELLGDERVDLVDVVDESRSAERVVLPDRERRRRPLDSEPLRGRACLVDRDEARRKPRVAGERERLLALSLDDDDDP